MKAFVTGGTGFIGGYLAAKLRERGDDVVALVRSPEKAGPLRTLGCELVHGDLQDVEALRAGIEGCDAVFHSAAVYQIGVRDRDCADMHEANVTGTERVLDAAIAQNVARIVYVSTVGYFGNTRRQIVDETYERPPGDFLSCYDETKYRAHRVALDRIAQGAPIVIAQPGGVYGPGDQSEIGNFVIRMATGKVPYMTFPDLGFNLGYVEDIADGIILVHDKGRIGESYVLGGEIATLGELVSKGAAIAGKKPPRFTIPPLLVKASVPFAPVVTKMMGLPPNLREMIRSSDGVTYWATDEKARRELGYQPRDLETGLKQTFAAL